ncbi:MAG: NlpC/P60 family protein, partial [Nitrospira sp.]|nr:NlpC/P60 family protein [Nitrospira sp.]
MRALHLITALTILTLTGCATAQDKRPRDHAAVGERSCCRSSNQSPSRAAIVRTAAKLVGARTIESNGRRIGYDCAGVTRAIFLEHGIDLYDTGAQDLRANGVRLIYAHARQHGTIHQGPAVNPGDLVFFDNTW